MYGVNSVLPHRRQAKILTLPVSRKRRAKAHSRQAKTKFSAIARKRRAKAQR